MAEKNKEVVHVTRRLLWGFQKGDGVVSHE